MTKTLNWKSQQEILDNFVCFSKKQVGAKLKIHVYFIMTVSKKN